MRGCVRVKVKRLEHLREIMPQFIQLISVLEASVCSHYLSMVCFVRGDFGSIEATVSFYFI